MDLYGLQRFLFSPALPPLFSERFIFLWKTTGRGLGFRGGALAHRCKGPECPPGLQTRKTVAPYKLLAPGEHSPLLTLSQGLFCVDPFILKRNCVWADFRAEIVYCKGPCRGETFAAISVAEFPYLFQFSFKEIEIGLPPSTHPEARSEPRSRVAFWTGQSLAARSICSFWTFCYLSLPQWSWRIIKLLLFILYGSVFVSGLCHWDFGRQSKGTRELVSFHLVRKRYNGEMGRCFKECCLLSPPPFPKSLLSLLP